MKKTSTIVCVVALFLGIPIWALWSGFVIQTLWGWFVAPLGVPVLGLCQAIGIHVLVSFLVAHGEAHRSAVASAFTDEQKAREILAALGRVSISPAIVLGVGWVVHHFMVQP